MGHFCPNTSQVPLPCPAGTFSAGSVTACLNCSIGYFCSNSNSQSQCSPGTFSLGQQVTGASEFSLKCVDYLHIMFSWILLSVDFEYRNRLQQWNLQLGGIHYLHSMSRWIRMSVGDPDADSLCCRNVHICEREYVLFRLPQWIVVRIHIAGPSSVPARDIFDDVKWS